MKVAIYKGVRNVAIEDRPKPVAGPGEAVVKVEYCGICGTDVHSYMHEGIIAPPTILGHETVGTVAELGQGTNTFKIGDRVAVGPPGNCGKCHNCLQGRASICTVGFERTTGITSKTDGGYAEYLLVRDPLKMLLPIPKNVSFEEAALFDIIGTAFHGIRRSRFKVGDTVLVSGAGPIGISAIMLLKLAGAGKLIATDVSDDRVKLALEYGADVALNAKELGPKLVEKVQELTGGKGADIVYECAGSPSSLSACIFLARSGGQVLAIGVSGEPTPIVTAPVVCREVDITTSFVYDAAEIEMVLNFIATGRLPMAMKMVTDIVKMDDVIVKGLERLSKPNDQMKILLAPNLN